MNADRQRGTPEEEADRAEQKLILKEAMREWLDEKFAQFGKWSATGMAAAGIVALAALILWSQGWHK